MYHRSTSATQDGQWMQKFSNVDADQVSYINWTIPTSSVITLGDQDDVNASGKSYIAFIFAHDDARFGENEDQSIIKCGFYLGAGSGTPPRIDLGFEPAFLLIKNVEGDQHWNLVDTMRGLPMLGEESIVVTPNAQSNPFSMDYVNLGGDDGSSGHANRGFTISDNGVRVNQSGKRHIYIAIAAQTGRNMKAITDPTKVFAIDLDGTNNGTPSWVSGFPVDMQFIKDRAGTTFNWFTSTRKSGKQYVSPLSGANGTANSVYNHQYSNGWGEYSGASGITSWMFRRHAGFDVQWYRGNNTARTIHHELGKVPHMIWVKPYWHSSNTPMDWYIYHKDINGGTDPEDWVMRFNNQAYDQAQWNDTAPTSSVFSVSAMGGTNNGDARYIAFLWTSIAGMSKCGGYNGSSSTVTVNDLGFAPKFILIGKYTDTNGAGDWVVFDTARGIAAGNDCYLYFNQNNAQDCNYDVIDLVTSPDGFEIPTTGSINDNGEKYIYYAHA
tara:strand:- start:105 stop:1592 length:1488 start_codon:yes stop_codon:yes gene_type:complete